MSYLDDLLKFRQDRADKCAQSKLSLYWGERYFNYEANTDLAVVKCAMSGLLKVVNQDKAKISLSYQNSVETACCQKLKTADSFLISIPAQHYFILSDDSNVKFNEIIDVYSGFLFHEYCHAKWTEFENVPKDKLIFTLWNALEDNRIEYLFDETNVGFSPYLHCMNKYITDYLAKDFKYIWEEPAKDLANLFGRILTYVEFLTEEEKSFETPKGTNVYDAIDKCLASAKIVSPKDVSSYAINLDRLYKKLLADWPPEKRKAKAEPNLVDQPLSSFNNSENKDAVKELLNSSDMREFFEELSSKTDKSNLVKGKLADIIPKELSEIVAEAESEAGQMMEDMEEKAEGAGHSVVTFDGGKTSFSSFTEVIKSITESERAEYKTIREKLHNHIKSFRSIFNYRVHETDMLESQKLHGKLDGRRLGTAFIDPYVFKQNKKVLTTGLSVFLLLDESGSMGSVNYPNSKAQRCRDISIMLSEALKSVPDIDLHIGSFTTGGSADQRFKYFYGKHSKNSSFVMDYAPGAGNYDHAALIVAGKYLKYSKYKHKYIFIVCDGMPNGIGYGGATAEEMVKEAVNRLEREGIQTVQIALEGNIASEKMYKHWVKFTDHSRLTTDFKRLFTKLIKKYK